MPRLPKPLLLALALLVLSLGLPWVAIGPAGSYSPGSFIPGYCNVSYYDNTTFCISTGIILPGFRTPGPGDPVPGYASGARLALVAGIVLTLIAARRPAPAIPIAIAALVVSVFLYGGQFHPGSIAALAAALLLGLHLLRHRLTGDQTADADSGSGQVT